MATDDDVDDHDDVMVMIMIMMMMLSEMTVLMILFLTIQSLEKVVFPKRLSLTSLTRITSIHNC